MADNPGMVSDKTWGAMTAPEQQNLMAAHEIATKGGVEYKPIATKGGADYEPIPDAKLRTQKQRDEAARILMGPADKRYGGRQLMAKGFRKKDSFNTPSGGVSAHGRREAKETGHTLPGTDKFPIRNLSDLAKAKHDIGRTSEPRGKVVAWIDRRARELGGKGVGESRADKRYGRSH